MPCSRSQASSSTAAGRAMPAKSGLSIQENSLGGGMQARSQESGVRNQGLNPRMSDAIPGFFGFNHPSESIIGAERLLAMFLPEDVDLLPNLGFDLQKRQ